MSHLSQAEATAGISRNAIAAIQRRNGHSKNGATAISSGENNSYQKPHPAPPPELTQVLRTWCRALDIINIDGWHFRIRDTVHLGDRPNCDVLTLTRTDLEALGNSIKRVLEESGPRAEL